MPADYGFKLTCYRRRCRALLLKTAIRARKKGAIISGWNFECILWFFDCHWDGVHPWDNTERIFKDHRTSVVYTFLQQLAELGMRPALVAEQMFEAFASIADTRLARRCDL